MQAAIFVRVSRKEQDYMRQVQDLRSVADRMGLEIVSEISEKISGTAATEDREGIQQLLDLARRRKISKVLVQEVSRLGRSTLEVLQIVEELTNLGVSIYVENIGIETLTKGKANPIAQVLLTILAEFARMEKEVLRERILSGLDEARRKGVKIGRPEGVLKQAKDYIKGYPKVVKYLNQGHSLRNTAKLTDVSVNTVRRVKAAMDKPSIPS
jgi:DNA invertase Pin-like site-specific DNA recombinase